MNTRSVSSYRGLAENSIEVSNLTCTALLRLHTAGGAR